MYTGLTLQSYFDEFDITPFVFEEPNTPKYNLRSRCNTFTNKDRLGCVNNWLHCVEELLIETDTPFIMTMEDDVQWLPGVGQKIKTVLQLLLDGKLSIDKIGFISPYCSERNKPTNLGWREPRYLKSGWCGALNLIFPRKSLEKIIYDRDRFLLYAVDEQKPEKGFIHLDYPIGRVAMEERLMILTHSPTLVQHLGEVSTFGKTTGRHNPNREPNV